MPIFSYLCSWVKPRQNRHDEPSTTFSLGKKKRTKSGLSKSDNEDHQRSIMIRKSLQSRASSRATGRPGDDNYDTEEEDSSTSLRTDWKAYEADIQRNKSTLMRSHPGVDRTRIQTRGGSSSSRPQPQSFLSSSTNPYSPTSPTSTISTPSPASPGIERAFS
jgi:hypothetical protein